MRSNMNPITEETISIEDILLNQIWKSLKKVMTSMLDLVNSRDEDVYI